jgi:hypothetical protein
MGRFRKRLPRQGKIMRPVTHQVWACSVVLLVAAQPVFAADHELHIIGWDAESNFGGGNQAVIAERMA